MYAVLFSLRSPYGRFFSIKEDMVICRHRLSSPDYRFAATQGSRIASAIPRSSKVNNGHQLAG